MKRVIEMNGFFDCWFSRLLRSSVQYSPKAIHPIHSAAPLLLLATLRKVLVTTSLVGNSLIEKVCPL